MTVTFYGPFYPRTLAVFQIIGENNHRNVWCCICILWLHSVQPSLVLVTITVCVALGIQ